MLDAAVYERGGLTLYALRAEVGADTFTEILRTYFERFNDRSVTTDDFVEVAEDVSGKDLDRLFAAGIRRVSSRRSPNKRRAKVRSSGLGLLSHRASDAGGTGFESAVRRRLP